MYSIISMYKVLFERVVHGKSPQIMFTHMNLLARVYGNVQITSTPNWQETLIFERLTNSHQKSHRTG
ncbi:MAG: hypothetical protein AAGF54_18190, partial [Pseudomonadota bacterium]